MSDRIIQAQRTANGLLTDEQIGSWREQGYTFVGGLIPETLVAKLTESALSQFPHPNAPEAEQITNFGSEGAPTFPSQAAGFNEITLHENIICSIAALLNVPPEELRLTQSDLWPKYGRKGSTGRFDNQDQRIHVDYPNHNLAHPAPWNRPEAVELILYLSDWTHTGGSTAIVPRTKPTNGRKEERKDTQDLTRGWPIIDSPGIGDLDYVNDRSEAETYFAQQRPQRAELRTKLYERELLTAFKPGDILFYRHDAWHRGTPVLPGQLRLAQNMTYRLAHAEWINTLHVGWSWQAYSNSKFLERLIAKSSLLQRAVLGFPQPNSSYSVSYTHLTLPTNREV